MCLKTSNGEKSNLLAYVCFCACEKKNRAVSTMKMY